MPKIVKILCWIMIIALIGGAQNVEAKNRHGRSVKHHKVHRRAMVDSTASYADIVIDAESGRILHATNADSLRHPASLTKMMTLYLTFQALESGKLTLNQYFSVSSNAASQSPSKLGLRAGQRIQVEDAILGLVTESANDAAVVIAEGLGGSTSAFGQMMTRQARALGMTRSHFDNPSGLPDPDQITTARDMAVLGHALIYHFPQFYPYFSHDSFTYAGINHRNHNHLMERYDGMDGIKTGYIRASGFNLVASAKRGNTRLIGVVFGGRSAVSRDNQMAMLLDDAFAMIESGGAATSSNARNIDDVIAQGDGNDGASDVDDVELPAKSVREKTTRSVVRAQSKTTQPAAPKTNPQPAVIVASNTMPSLAKPPEQTTAQPTQKKNWGIQIGAYGDPEIGHQALANVAATLPQWLGDANPIVQKVSSGSVTMFRARLMSLDVNSAQNACHYLNQHGQGCLLVSP